VGATHLSAGTIDILGYAPERVERPGEALAGLGDGHPYGLVGAGAVAASVDWLKALVRDGSLAPYAYHGGLDENLLLSTALGVPRPSAVVPETMLGGDLRRSAPVLVVGFRGLKDFYPALLADTLRRTGRAARAVELDLVPEGRADVNSLGYARAFDSPRFRAEVTAQLLGRLRVDERVGFPAVLGIADPHGAWSDLERRLARPVFEVPTLPPSVPGMRLFAILREALRRAGGRMILNAVVTGAEREGGRVSAVRARVGLREERRACDWVVLATGGFASGGLELDSHWTARETALGLPVAGVPAPGEERFAPGYLDDHPIARAGVAAGSDLRPEGHENVLVAGATLAGAEPWREKSGDGISLATGHRAAELVLVGTRSLAATG
jgi:glycerol-3-phosphate dehydrogenase subunit B